PPLQFERLMLAGKLSTFGWSDLRFDAEEAQGLLAKVFGVAVDAEVAATVNAAVDGWAGGLMLTGPSLQSGEIEGAFPGGPEEVPDPASDYLLDHVWIGLSASLRDFLLDTAALGRFCPALADAVRERTDSAELLDRLRLDGLFLVREGGPGTWLRYQRLFRHV